MLDFGFKGPIDILIWVGVVLAIGFIGYFGRYLSMLIIEKLHRRKSGSPPTEIPAGKSSSPAGTVPRETRATQATVSKSQLKLDKKRAKQAVKKVKKGG
jgi:hypothetical protein